MVALHETGHTFLHENQLHTDAELNNFGVIGDIDKRMNQIRSELGPRWGQRLSYTYLNVNGYNYTPMTNATGVIKQKSSIMGQLLGYE